MTVLGAVTDNGDSFYCWTEESLTRHHGICLLEALQEEFGEELVVFLDRVGYFYARDVWEYVSGKRETKLSATVRSRAWSGMIWLSGTFHRNCPNSIRWKGAGTSSTNGSNIGLFRIFRR